MDIRVDPSKVWPSLLPKRPETRSHVGPKRPEPWTAREKDKSMYQTSLDYRYPDLLTIEMEPYRDVSKYSLLTCELREMQFRRTRDESTWKHPPYTDPLLEAKRMSVTHSNYIKPFRDQIIRNLPKEPDLPMSEYKYNYLFNEYAPSYEDKDYGPKVYLKINAIAKEGQSQIDPQLGGCRYIMDPYISTSHFDYHYKDMAKVRSFEPYKVVQVKKIETRPENIQDAGSFKVKSSKFPPTKFKSLPNSGRISETKASYGVPVDELCYKSDGIEDTIVVTNMTRGEVMAVPAMYHTDYSHLGTSWSPRALV